MDNEMVQCRDNRPAGVKWGISGSTLKWIALITMLIDHIGAVLIWRLILVENGATEENPQVLMVAYSNLMQLYMVMRMIGRIAFPIFCFLMVEGMQRTHNRLKYVGRLFAFALLSEIPFDLAFSGSVLEFSYQNVFFTLLLGLLAMTGADRIEQYFQKQSMGVGRMICRFLLLAADVAFFAAVAWILKTDYGAIGIACIMALYFSRNKKSLQILTGCVAFCWEISAPLAFLPIGFYNGKRGMRLKYVFYIFYPAHLFVLYLICVYLGISGIPAI